MPTSGFFCVEMFTLTEMHNKKIDHIKKDLSALNDHGYINFSDDKDIQCHACKQMAERESSFVPISRNYTRCILCNREYCDIHVSKQDVHFKHNVCAIDHTEYYDAHFGLPNVYRYIASAKEKGASLQ